MTSSARRHESRLGADPVQAPPAATLLHANGRPLEADVRAQMQTALGHDFGAIRVHTDAATAAGARAVGARAFTVGQHIGFAAGRYAPHSPAGTRLLAHELAHTLQQRPGGATDDGALQAAESEAQHAALAATDPAGAPVQVGSRVGMQPQFDLESPSRLATVHTNIFPAAPAPGGGAAGGSSVARLPWQPRATAGGGTAALIVREVRAALAQIQADDPDQFAAPPIRTSEADIDQDVLIANTRLRTRFPQITVSVSDAQLQAAAGVLGPAETGTAKYQHDFVWNLLPDLSSVEDYALDYGDAEAEALRNELLADSDLGWRLRAMSRRVAGMHTGVGLAHIIRVNRGADATIRSATLVHELVHMFAHATYTRWVATTANDDLYDEGITDWLARQVMTAAEQALRSRYTDRRQRVEREIVPHVSEDDIARAYFQGEIWRMETRSNLARDEFAAASGIRRGAGAGEEATASRAGPGINQEVVPSAHYRFLNLGHDRAEPKPEHLTYFRQLKTRLLDPQPTAELRFVGHASSPGSWAHNDRLSLLRAQAFYRMARDAGVADARLRDAGNPPHHGEHVPTLTEEDTQTRAFNRRVELQLFGVARATGALSGSRAAPAAEREEL
jgi:outer membrane protein OmpA-like peptidoglycan-associated protein